MKHLLKGAALAVVLCFSSGFAVAADFNPEAGSVYMKDSTFDSEVRINGSVIANCQGQNCGVITPIGSIDAGGGVSMNNSKFISEVDLNGSVIANCQGQNCKVTTPIGSIVAGR